ncbi:MAG: TonB-dependent receptor [Anaeromyxobacter sp.]
MRRLARVLFATGLGLADPAAAEVEVPVEPDAVELDTMVIRTGKADSPGVTTTHLDREALDPLDAGSAAELLEAVPGAQARTNSRGETLVYVRNSGERQLAVFLDGAPLNVPWDNRVDLSLVPAPLVDRIAVVQGPAPVEYGTNVAGGVVELATGWSRGARRAVAEVQGGTGGRLQLSAGHGAGEGPWRWSFGVTHAQADGQALASGADLAFSQPDGALRTNTDARTTAIAARGGWDGGRGTSLALTVAHLDAERGIAPEGHRDPSVARVRFWRYPEARTTMAVVSAEGAPLPRLGWRGSAWASRSVQLIDAYADATYTTVRSREDDDDRTFGGRLTGRYALGLAGLTLAVNGLSSTHLQRDLSFGATATPAPRLVYRQATFSSGAALDAAPWSGAAITAGMSWDAMSPIRTGDKPDLDRFDGLGASVGVTQDLGQVRLRAAAGRKVRFPTLRELFGDALGQFLINPGLKPETSLLGEAGVEVRAAGVRAGLTAFGTRTRDAIDQRSVTLPGETRPRRQRINLEGSRVVGAELALVALLPHHLEADGSLVVSRARRVAGAPGGETRLAEKPDTLGRLALGWAPPAGASARVSASYTGRAYSLADDGSFVALPTSLAIDVRVGWRVRWEGGRTAELFVRADNVTDATVVPQLGLPAPGRTVLVGANVGF